MPPVENYETAKEAAARLGYDYAYFTRLLNADRVPGAIKWQRVWVVPASVTREQVERRPGRPKSGPAPSAGGEG